MATDHDRQLILVTNIPSPYRLHSFAVLAQELAADGIHLQILFMSKTESGRRWEVDASIWEFDGQIVPGIHPYLLNMDMHLNPGVWSRVFRARPDWLIIGGGWQFPTSMGLYLLRPLFGKHSHVLGWAEANSRFSQHNSGPIASLRRMLLLRVDGLVLPGKLAQQTVEDHWKINTMILFWPNLVQKEIYCDEVSRLRPQKNGLREKYNIPASSRVLFWSARLEELTKGIQNFLKRAHPVLSHSSTTIVIAGDGPDRAAIENWLHNTAPELDVRLLGHVDQSQVIEWLALADVAMLPSLRDSNPLSVIEALWAGLPILSSINCGNWPETVEVGNNGWLINPVQTDDVHRALRDILTSSPERLAAMGEASREIAEKHFDSRRATRRFVDSLLHNFPPKG
jgi:glycosyltransferase involved in cell wall biosynthesis